MLSSAELDQLEDDGFLLLPNVFSATEIQQILAAWSHAICNEDQVAGALRSQSGNLYGARNVLALWPDVIQNATNARLRETVKSVLGEVSGIVRVLFFDKPPQQSWSLPWHKDLTIAVQDNSQPSTQFCKPTTKAGVPHVEAPEATLAQMLTVRVHLDEMSLENGTLQVIPGSHRGGKKNTADVRSPLPILSGAGDVLLMRPMLSHCSGHSDCGLTQHRRILHFECAASPDLPDRYSWHTFFSFNP
jgi:hypothetical protein